MVYDPIRGCVRGFPLKRKPKEFIADQLINETTKNLFSNPLVRTSKLYFTIGAARSGKSTYCTRWAQHLEIPGDKYPRAIVCADDIRLALHGEIFKREAESMVFSIKNYMIKALLSRGHDVIVDGTHSTLQSIRSILDIRLDAEYILFETSLEECEARAIKSGHNHLVEYKVIRRHWKQIEKLKAYGIDKTIEDIKQKLVKRWS